MSSVQSLKHWVITTANNYQATRISLTFHLDPCVFYTNPQKTHKYPKSKEPKLSFRQYPRLKNLRQALTGRCPPTNERSAGTTRRHWMPHSLDWCWTRNPFECATSKPYKDSRQSIQSSFSQCPPIAIHPRTPRVTSLKFYSSTL